MISKKRFISIFICVLLAMANSYAQVYRDTEFYEEIEKEIINDLPNKTLIVPVPDLSDIVYADFIKIVQETWHYSPLKFVNSEDLEQYKERKEYYILEPTNANLDDEDFNSLGQLTLNPYFNFCLHYYHYNGKDQKKAFTDVKVAGIMLLPDFKTLLNPRRNVDCFYTFNGHIKNLSPGFLKNYLTILQKEIAKPYVSKTFVTPDSKLKSLANDTLLVPDYCLIKLDTRNGNENQKSVPEILFKDYKYPYRVATTEEISQRIQKGEQSSFYLHFTRNMNQVMINIIDGKSGEVLYSLYGKNYQFNLRETEIKQLNKEISKFI